MQTVYSLSVILYQVLHRATPCDRNLTIRTLRNLSTLSTPPAYYPAVCYLLGAGCNIVGMASGSGDEVWPGIKGRNSASSAPSSSVACAAAGFWSSTSSSPSGPTFAAGGVKCGPLRSLGMTCVFTASLSCDQRIGLEKCPTWEGRVRSQAHMRKSSITIGSEATTARM